MKCLLLQELQSNPGIETMFRPFQYLTMEAVGVLTVTCISIRTSLPSMNGRIAAIRVLNRKKRIQSDQGRWLWSRNLA